VLRFQTVKGKQTLDVLDMVIQNKSIHWLFHSLKEYNFAYTHWF
jgi:hypothetical protein